MVTVESQLEPLIELWTWGAQIGLGAQVKAIQLCDRKEWSLVTLALSLKG